MSKRKSIFESVPYLHKPAGTSSSTDAALELESIDQEILKTLLMIHYNLDLCNQIINEHLIPTLKQHQQNSKNINNSTRFLKNLFENLLNVNIQVQPNSSTNKSESRDLKQAAENINALAKSVDMSSSENAFSESILASSNMVSSSLPPPPRTELKGTEDPQATPTGKRALKDLFANRSKVGLETTESSLAIASNSILPNNSIIDQGTSTFSMQQPATNSLIPPTDSIVPPTSSLVPSLGYTIQISPKKRTLEEPTTPKRRKNRKSQAILEKLDIEDSPDDIPKTPELTYLKFLPIKLRKDRNTENSTFFDSSAENFGLPPVSTRFALPKTTKNLEKSPVKVLARRYTQDYLDMEIDDGSELSEISRSNASMSRDPESSASTRDAGTTSP